MYSLEADGYRALQLAKRHDPAMLGEMSRQSSLKLRRLTWRLVLHLVLIIAILAAWDLGLSRESLGACIIGWLVLTPFVWWKRNRFERELKTLNLAIEISRDRPASPAISESK